MVVRYQTGLARLQTRKFQLQWFALAYQRASWEWGLPQEPTWWSPFVKIMRHPVDGQWTRLIWTIRLSFKVLIGTQLLLGFSLLRFLLLHGTDAPLCESLVMLSHIMRIMMPPLSCWWTKIIRWKWLDCTICLIETHLKIVKVLFCYLLQGMIFPF